MVPAWPRAGYNTCFRATCSQKFRCFQSQSIPRQIGGAAASSKPRTIVSGVQPTGIPHLGNYLGALQSWVNLQDEAATNSDELFFFVASLHAITIPQDPKRLLAEKRDVLAALLAIGLDPHRCTIFQQDQVLEHTELAWYLNCLTPVGKLNRMTTWKSKLATSRDMQSTEQISETHLALGLFAYPVLQAADVLIYRATHVPVGEDQIQHLELSRDVGDLFNRTFRSKLFPLPQHIITPTKRILSLRDPSQKMSKSHPDSNSRILLTDTDAHIQNKIKKAVTDAEDLMSYDPAKRPGVSNLLSIMAALQSSKGPIVTATDIAETLNRDHGGRGSALKATVTDTIVEHIRPIRDSINRIKADVGYLIEVEKLGREKAQRKAAETMAQVRKLVGMTE
ncbi:hypothetical protein CBS101457_000525 [Exobasidium rhododendri]|nr:hypothetical protein CBS101457_000525 [Exobasidium rhododendri]